MKTAIFIATHLKKKHKMALISKNDPDLYNLISKIIHNDIGKNIFYIYRVATQNCWPNVRRFEVFEEIFGK